MRVVFLGSPAFAVPTLEALLQHPQIEVPLVVTQPDRPAGRGRSLTPPPVKVAAEHARTSVFQPETLKDPVAVDVIRQAQPDVLIVVAYGEILRRDVLTLTPHGALNVHPSLLPLYRGATPIPAAILNGDIITGVSIIRLERRLDAGPMIAQQAHEIQPDDTSGTLGDRLARVAASMLPGTAVRFVQGQLEPVSQDDTRATYTREWTTADARIDWTRPAVDIERLVRASNPWPVAWSSIDGARVRVTEARVDDASSAAAAPGTIDATSKLPRVATGDGWLALVHVQPAGKRSMPAGDWLRGTRLMSPRFDVD